MNNNKQQQNCFNLVENRVIFLEVRGWAELREVKSSTGEVKKTYRAKKGGTLGRLALANKKNKSLGAKIFEIAKHNKIENPNIIWIGQQVEVITKTTKRLLKRFMGLTQYEKKPKKNNPGADFYNISAKESVEKNELLKKIKPCDIIFQTSTSRQSKALELATNSDITHMGILVRKNGFWHVLEATHPVKLTPLATWKARGKEGKISIKRINKEINYDPIIAYAQKQVGKNYDTLFQWGDESFYCSELVFKAFKQGGVEIGKPTQIKYLDFSSPEVKKLMIRRLKLSLPPKEQAYLSRLLKKHKTFAKIMQLPEWPKIKARAPKRALNIIQSYVITPKSIYKAKNLHTVYSEY